MPAKTLNSFFALFLFFLLFFLLPSPGIPEETGISDRELLENLEEKMADISTVSADFRQEKQLAVLERTMTIKGRMAMEIPDNIAWHVEEPVRYRMIIRNSQLRQWDEDTDQIQTLDLDRNPVYGAMFQQLTGWFSGRYEELLEHYNLKVESIQPPVLVFTPRTDTMAEDFLTSVTIVFGEDARYIEKIIMHEVNDSLSTIYFDNAQFDKDFDEHVWEVRPPH